MVGTSKILTVSYGTFSCTLEGFDDSFNTMKAIAEYFRGLAADDRYFGAEPPTPDAELLAKIAEREISRRVDARMDDDGIVLRAAALTDGSKADADGDAPVHDAESRAQVEAARKEAKAARQAEKAAAKAERKAKKAAEKAAKEEARAKRDAEKEAKAKAKAEAEAEAQAKAEAEAKADAEAEAEARAEKEAEAKSEHNASAESEGDAEAEVEAETYSDDTDILSSVSAATAALPEGSTGSDVEETRDDAPSSVLATNDPVPAHPDADSVAAKLQRIRAVVGQADNDPTNDATEPFLPQAETPDVADVEPEGTKDAEMADDPVADFDAHEAELDVEDADDDNVPGDASEEVAKGGTDMISRVMARHTSSEDEAADDASEVEPAPTTQAQPRARVIRMKRSEFEKAKSDAESEPAEETPAPTVPNLGLLDGADDLDDYLEDSDFTDEDLAADLDLIEETITEETEAHAPDMAAESPVEPEAATPPVDHVEAVADDETSDDASDEDAISNAFLADDGEVEDEALDRLMSETDVQMKEPEGSRRRDAIAQLKAAVAAKEAARQVGEADDDGQDVENAFRNDLSEAVRPEGTPRPRPVVRSGQRTERPRPAPLKLVAAQRVDVQSDDAPTSPVVPRRVAARRDEAAKQSAGSFAEFAENMGASELPDLLEAAAAYTAFVEGADEFSRPQILRRVRAVASDDFKREDGLRSFADLLRAGRFTKVRNGRFQVADDSRFNPERQAS